MKSFERDSLVLTDANFLEEIDSEYYVTAYEINNEKPLELSLNNLDMSDLISLTVGMHIVQFKLVKYNSMSKIYLHFHTYEEINNCTSVCKEMAYCTLMNKKHKTEKKSTKYDRFFCSLCGTTVTPLWRKNGRRIVCNACGLYFRTHGGAERPKSLFKIKNAKKSKKVMDK